MVLRLLLVALVLANIGYFLWSRAASHESAERQPQKLTQQIRPELLDIRRAPAPNAAAPAAEPSAPASSP